MAATKTLTASEILTGGPWDPAVTNYAPTLQLVLFAPFAASTIISNALINTKTSPVYEVWSTPTPFDPATQQINLSYTSNAGSKLSTTHNSSTSTLSLTSGNNNVNFWGSWQVSGTNTDSNGNPIDGTTTVIQNVSYTDTKGTTTQYDDTTAYFNGTLKQVSTVKSGFVNMDINWQGSTTYFADGVFLYINGSYGNQSTVTGTGTSSVWTTHSASQNIADYKYWTKDFGLEFSGTQTQNLDNKTATISLKNISVYDIGQGSKTTASQATVNLSNINPSDINFGGGFADNISGVQAFFTSKILPTVLNSGVIVTSTNALGSILNGGSKNDTITGGDGKDTIFARGGNDTIDGGLGVNTAVYSGKFADYVVKAASGNTYTISDSVSDRDGTDTLTNIQYLQFSDVTKAVSEVVTSGGTPLTTPTLTVPAAINLTASQSVNVSAYFTPQTTKAGAPIDLWIFYETGSGLGAYNGHIHVNNGYILQNNIWSVFSGDAPAGTLVAVTGADFAQTVYSAPKIVGVQDHLYSGFVSQGQWSNTAHLVINT